MVLAPAELPLSLEVGFTVVTSLSRFGRVNLMIDNKNSDLQEVLNLLGRCCGAQKRTRISTTLRSLAPEASASTNSATWAWRGNILF
jgi:hypothetical protein